jgi:two-component system sensor histidine kinase KdpD
VEWYHIAEVIHDVLSRMRPLLQGRPVQTSIPDDLPPVELDYLQIDQVLTNLIENAIRYTPPESPIDVSVRYEKESDREQVVVSVADRGAGIPPNDRERVFDKFYRVLGMQQNADYPTTGSGLGLAVCKGLVEAHGGHIWTEPRAGGGAVFLVELPVGTFERMSI